MGTNESKPVDAAASQQPAAAASTSMGACPVKHKQIDEKAVAAEVKKGSCPIPHMGSAPKQDQSACPVKQDQSASPAKQEQSACPVKNSGQTYKNPSVFNVCRTLRFPFIHHTCVTKFHFMLLTNAGIQH